MKNKFLKLMALFVAGAFAVNVGAQETNIIANWDGGSSTSKPTEFGWSSSNSGRSWGTLNGSDARVTDNYSGYKLENGSTYSYNKDSEPSSKILWIRYNNNGQTEKYTYTFEGLKPLHSYDFSGLVGWHNNDGGPTFTITINGATEFAQVSTNKITSKQTLYKLATDFSVPADDESETFALQFTCSYGKNEKGSFSHDCMEAISALSITLDVSATIDVMKKHLTLLTSQATNINKKIDEDIDFNDELDILNKEEKTEDYIAELESAISSLKNKIIEATENYKFDPTGEDVTAFYIANNGFDEEINFSSESTDNTVAATVYPTLGWTSNVGGNCTGATIGYGYEGSINGGHATAPTTNSDDTEEGGALFICVGWSGTVIYKSLPATLAAGLYTITYKAYNGNTRDANALDIIPLIGFVPEEGEAIISNTTETFANQRWVEKTYSFTLSEETKGQIQIGMRPTANTNSYYAPELFIDKITLTYYNPSIKALMDAVEKAKNATAVNVGVNAFQHPQAAADILNSTREDAEDILANASDIETIEDATADLNEAIDVFEAAELNAPEDNTRYTFTFNCEGHSANGNAITLIENGRGDQGLYGIKYLTKVNANYAQAFTLTKATGKDYYYFSQTNPNNETIYLTTATLGYDVNSFHSGLRLTTDATKALEVQIQPTTTNGNYILYNTAAKAAIAHNGNDNNDAFTNNSATFTISEAKQAEVTLKVTDLGWATLMLPFNAEIPTGLEVWSCTGEENGVLALEEVGSIVANTPYVVSGVGEYTFADYGLAKQDTYAGTMFTGTYAETAAPVGSYVLQNGTNGFGFYKVAEGKQPKVGAYRCYITDSESAAPMFRIGEDETTGIKPSTLNAQPSTVAYDLQGRRVEKMEKGIYIVNGKKVVIR